MSDLDSLRHRKLQQLQEQQQAEQQLTRLEMVVKQRFTTSALQRYGNLKAAHPETAMQLVVLIAQAMQNGQLHKQIDDEALKKILGKLTEKRDIKITRR